MPLPFSPPLLSSPLLSLAPALMADIFDSKDTKNLEITQILSVQEQEAVVVQHFLVPWGWIMRDTTVRTPSLKSIK